MCLDLQKILVILRDKTMNGLLMNDPNYERQNYPVCRLKPLAETFEKTNQSKFIKFPQGYKANDKDNCIIKL